MIIELDYFQIQDLLMAIEASQINPTMETEYANDTKAILESALPFALDNELNDLPDSEKTEFLQTLKEMEDSRYKFYTSQENMFASLTRSDDLLSKIKKHLDS